jgi:thiol-disulfide isomerase/thioredoxin
LASLVVAALLFVAGASVYADGGPAADGPKLGGPTDAKARKTFAGAAEFGKQGDLRIALEEYLKANKQDGGHCELCLKNAYTLAVHLGDYKVVEGIVREWLPLAQTDAARATLHFQLGVALQREGLNTKKDTYFKEACDEFRAALQVDPGLAAAHYALGSALASLHQDDAARAEFETFLKQDKDNMDAHARAQRFAERVELARAKMAPPFSLVTLDGRHVSMDEFTGKVVLIDFWATWCGPCREALPHIRQIAQEFKGQQFVVLSISLDKDDAKWKDFVAKNGMTWLQYRDGYFNGPIATEFAVDAIPATFSIDADGVLEDQHVGDGNIEGKLKKMIAQAVELSNRKPITTDAEKSSGAGSQSLRTPPGE